jgi:hypothetical protein
MFGTYYKCPYAKEQKCDIVDTSTHSFSAFGHLDTIEPRFPPVWDGGSGVAVLISPSTVSSSEQYRKRDKKL